MKLRDDPGEPEAVPGIRMQIEMNSQGQVRIVTDPPEAVSNKAIVYGMLLAAQDEVQEHHIRLAAVASTKEGPRIVPPSADDIARTNRSTTGRK